MGAETIGTDISVIVATTPVVVLQDNEQALKLFAHIKSEIATFKYNLKTATGRKEIAALAYKISRTKTAVDSAGVTLIEDANKIVKSVNADRKRTKEMFDELRDMARAPLTKWEEAEDKRISQCNAHIDELRAFGVIAVTASSDDVQTDLNRVLEIIAGKNNAIKMDVETYGELYRDVVSAAAQAKAALEAALVRLKQEEADHAELQRLRRENAERERVQAETAETERLAQEKAAQERQAEELKKQEEAAAQRRADEAAEAARQEEVRKAEEARAEQERVHADEIAKAKKENDDLLAKQEHEKAERTAEAQRIADEEKERAENQRHRKKVMGTAAKALVSSCKLSPEVAEKVILAIAANQIPNISVEF